VVLGSVLGVLALAGGMAAGSDAQGPFDVYYRPPEPVLTYDAAGPRIPTGSAPSSIRLSRSGTLTYPVGPFAEPVSGTVSFHTVKAVSAKAKKRKLTLGAKDFRARARQRAKVRMKLSRRNRAVLRRYGKLKIRTRIRAADANGNDSYKSLYFTLKRPR
jgi:hypothetical protein